MVELFDSLSDRTSLAHFCAVFINILQPTRSIAGDVAYIPACLCGRLIVLDKRVKFRDSRSNAVRDIRRAGSMSNERVKSIFPIVRNAYA